VLCRKTYSEICVHFGINSVENLGWKIGEIASLADGETLINYLCQMLCWFISFVSLHFYCVCLSSVCCTYSFISATMYDGEIKLYITWRCCLGVSKFNKLKQRLYEILAIKGLISRPRNHAYRKNLACIHQLCKWALLFRVLSCFFYVFEVWFK